MAAGAHPLGALGLRAARARGARCCSKHKNLWADLAFRTDHALGRQGGSGLAQRCSSSSPTASWSAPTRYVPERWHYVPEHARVVARAGSRTCRATSPSASHGKTAKRFLVRFCTALICRGVAACEPGCEGTRLESPRFVLAFKPEAVAVAQHFSLDIAVCAKSGGGGPNRRRSMPRCRSIATA